MPALHEVWLDLETGERIDGVLEYDPATHLYRRREWLTGRIFTGCRVLHRVEEGIHVEFIIPDDSFRRFSESINQAMRHMLSLPQTRRRSSILTDHAIAAHYARSAANFYFASRPPVSPRP